VREGMGCMKVRESKVDAYALRRTQG